MLQKKALTVDVTGGRGGLYDIVNPKVTKIENESNKKGKSSLDRSNNEDSIVELSVPNANNPDNNEDDFSDVSDSVILTALL